MNNRIKLYNILFENFEDSKNKTLKKLSKLFFEENSIDFATKLYQKHEKYFFVMPWHMIGFLEDYDRDTLTARNLIIELKKYDLYTEEENIASIQNLVYYQKSQKNKLIDLSDFTELAGNKRLTTIDNLSRILNLIVNSSIDDLNEKLFNIFDSSLTLHEANSEKSKIEFAFSIGLTTNLFYVGYSRNLIGTMRSLFDKFYSNFVYISQLREAYFKYLLQKYGVTNEIFDKIYNFDFQSIYSRINEIKKIEKNRKNLFNVDINTGEKGQLRYMETDDEGNQTTTFIQNENILIQKQAMLTLDLAAKVLIQTYKIIKSVYDVLKIFVEQYDKKYVENIKSLLISIKKFLDTEITPVINDKDLNHKVLTVFGDISTAFANMEKRQNNNFVDNAEILDEIKSMIHIIENKANGEYRQRIKNIILLSPEKINDLYILSNFNYVFELLNKLIAYVDFSEINLDSNNYSFSAGMEYHQEPFKQREEFTINNKEIVKSILDRLHESETES